MNDSRWKRLRELFDAAIALPPAQRPQFVAESCGDDRELKAELDSLVAGFEAPGSAAGDVVDRVRDQVARDLATEERVIGPYTLIEKIGEGGFGDVYRAEQSRPLRREVALKIVRLGMDTKQVIARFQAERQALALMDHPHIAKVFDAGATPTGRPYFVMELVDGLPITRYCDTHRLDLRERLTLFILVCRAVQHAHQKGLIHRDLKPSNLLVSGSAEGHAPKVIDFGIAKAVHEPLTGATAFTADQHFVGTPEYMSPEQIHGDGVDTRTDVHALGVVLYELLTGGTPLDGAAIRKSSLLEIQRAVLETEPERPSARRPSLDRELDWIILKALNKDRDRRYETADAFAADIQRYLDYEPVVAGPPSRTYRMRKFVRRNRAAAVGAAAVAVALAAGTGVSIVFAVGQRRALAVAREKTQAAEAINSFLVEDLLGSADAYSTGDTTITIIQALERASGRLGDRFADQPWVQASIHSVVGNAFQRLGRLDNALQHLESAEGLLAPAGDPLLRGKIASQASHVHELQGKYEASLDDTEKGLAALAGQPKNEVLAELWSRRVFTLKNLGRLDAAESAAHEAMAVGAEVYGAESEFTNDLRGLLAAVYYAQGRYAAALEQQEPYFHSLRERKGPDYGGTLIAQNNLAIYLGNNGRETEAIQWSQDLIERYDRILGPEHYSALTARATLAFTYLNMGKYAEALPIQEDVVPRYERVFGIGHPATVSMRGNLARVYHGLGRNEEAVALMAAVYQTQLGRFGGDHQETRKTITRYLPMLVALGRYDAALAISAPAAALAEETMGDHEYPKGLIYQHHASVLEAMARYEEAEAAFLRAHEILVESLGAENERTQKAASLIVAMYEVWGRPAQAEAFLAARRKK